MASGYHNLMYRLSGVLPSDRPGPADDIESLKDALREYFLGDALDEVCRDLNFQNFAIPALLTILYDFVGSDSHRIRLNEYMYRRLPQEIPAEDQADCVFGAMALVVETGSVPNVSMDLGHLTSFMYDLFPNLETFMRQVSPTVSPFVSAEIKLDNFSSYLASFQVS